jgi:hypothetical protein
MRYIIVLLLCTNLCVAQKAYEIPFPKGTGSSKGNVIELSVANTSKLSVEEVRVKITNAPAWLKFESEVDTLQQLLSHAEKTASFTFSVAKTAPVNKEQTLSFSITDKDGQKWTKDIAIKITPPATYELFQNYPNPFNPTTVISYQLSAISNVSLRIYDVIGREVANLVNEQQEPGYYQKTFDASRYASGMYIYRLIAKPAPSGDEQNKQRTFQKKMVLIR